MLAKTKISFFLNGNPVEIVNPNPVEPLISTLRHLGFTGTKLGCSEGGCGSCTLVIGTFNYASQTFIHYSVNACLATLFSVEGKHVISIEGLGNAKKPHPIQQKIADSYGSQCGYCTPGIAMSLYAFMLNNPNANPHEVEEAFDGNLCRCTGYRPILDGAKEVFTFYK